MEQRKRTSIRPLLLILMLVVGPVHAHSVLECAMTDMVSHDDCHCDDHETGKDCVDAAFDSTIDSDDEPCCERSVEINVDEDARRDTPGAKAVELRTDVDHPQTIVASFDPIEPPKVIATGDKVQSFPTPGRTGSDIYLITQRLRI